MLAACIDNNIVYSITTVSSDSEYQALGKRFAAVVDVTTQYPIPTVGLGWDGVHFLNGGRLIIDWRITNLALLNRFTQNEFGTYLTALPRSIALQMLDKKLFAAQWIDLSRPDTIQAIYYLAQGGIITTDRANAILTTIPQPIEAISK